MDKYLTADGKKIEFFSSTDGIHVEFDGQKYLFPFLPDTENFIRQFCVSPKFRNQLLADPDSITKIDLHHKTKKSQKQSSQIVTVVKATETGISCSLEFRNFEGNHYVLQSKSGFATQSEAHKWEYGFRRTVLKKTFFHIVPQNGQFSVLILRPCPVGFLILDETECPTRENAVNSAKVLLEKHRSVPTASLTTPEKSKKELRQEAHAKRMEEQKARKKAQNDYERFIATASLEIPGNPPQELLTHIFPFSAWEKARNDSREKDCLVNEYAKVFRESGFDSTEQMHSAWEKFKVLTQDKMLCAMENEEIRANGGFTRSKLKLLCEPENRENTLKLLFHLNHWAKAKDVLFRVDRDGLYKIKTAIIAELFRQGAFQDFVYVEDRENFMGKQLGINVFAVDILNDMPGSYNEEFEAKLLGAYQTVFQREFPGTISGEEIDFFVMFYENLFLQEKIKAFETKTVIDETFFTEKGIYGDNVFDKETKESLSDEIDFYGTDPYFDPEFFSLVRFSYQSESCRYSFHLPFRSAETFIPADTIRARKGEKGRESGELFGRPITDDESEKHPIFEILKSLGCYWYYFCPKRLETKESYFEKMENRFYERNTIEDEFR